MRAYRVVSDAGLPDALDQTDLPDPSPGPGEVAIRVRAASLNFRDLVITQGGYPRNDTRPVIPLSDGAGAVTAVGEGVTKWKTGDRVMPNFMRDFLAGDPDEAALASGLGGGVDGVLADTVVLPERSLVATPEHLSDEQAATLPCAALTAFNAIDSAPTSAGDTVLLLGTGGVSIFALQLAKARGATVIITSSSDEKLDKAKTLGADHTINYETHPEWHQQVRRITAGRGVDHVVEVGGPGTFERSLQSIRPSGTISMIGLLSKGQPNVIPILLQAALIRGIYVGSVALFEKMNRTIAAHRIEPVIDRVFGFDEVPAAYEHLASQKHVGKVVVRVD